MCHYISDVLAVCTLVGTSEAACGSISDNRRSQDLRAVPIDLIWTAYLVYLENNEIEEIRENDFKYTHNVCRLYLQDNRIRFLHPKAFSNMKGLQLLYLQNNKLDSSQFHSKMFYGHKSLIHLWLHNNEFQRLPWDIFRPSDYRGSDGHPPSLKLSLGRNPIKCDLSSCWLKQGAEAGWLTWALANVNGAPQCVDTQTTWPDIGVDCVHFGVYCFSIHF